MTLETLRQAEGLTASEEGAGELFDNAIALRLELTKLGIARKRSAADIQTDADPDLVRVGADMLEAEEYDAIVAADNDLRSWVRARSVSCPLFSAGAYMVKVRKYREIRDRVREYLTVERPALVDAFVQVYDVRAEEGRRKLGSLARANDYPPAARVREAFGGSMQWFGIAAPGALAGVDGEALEAEAEALRAEFQAAREAARVALRVEWSKLVDRMVDRLSPGADGARKRFTETLTANVAEFCELFDDRDWTNDGEIRAMLGKARAVLAGVDVETLRTDDELRARTAEVFGELKTQTDLMVRSGRAYGGDE